MLALEGEGVVGPLVLRADLGWAPAQTFYTQSFAPLLKHGVRAVVGAEYLDGDTFFASVSLFGLGMLGPPPDAAMLGLEPADLKPAARPLALTYGGALALRWAPPDTDVEARGLFMTALRTGEK